ncbi:hypothetical protein ANCCAN_06510 [Ancylostoma caninum]|uniref:HAT C-terminal dimerisation domain-containing protein n=1 Tax=Ancylostoma caninum TaxID=29170 RepID=A0A368GVV8_ANCCA|nr:hypothetical protein ANCCAN_06510 [Ancylostoma caninum]
MKEFRNLELSDLSRRDALIADDPYLYYHLEDAPDFDVRHLQSSSLGKAYESSKPPVLLNNTIALLVPNEVAQAICCVLVIPASNVDPERSFSAANRLSREERSNINTLDDLMTVQRDGPSLFSVNAWKSC